MGGYWAGYGGTPWGAWGWVIPVIGLVFMAVMVFLCVRMMAGMGGGGCLGSHRHSPTDDTEALRRELRALKEDIKKLRETH